MPTLTDAERYIEKKLGIRLIRGSSPNLQIERISTGLLSLDHILGGGIPLGRILDIFGMPKIGKTSLALEIARQYVERGWPVFYADVEHALDPALATVHDVDLNAVQFATPADGEDFLWGDKLLQSIYLLAREWDHGLVVVDSVPALIPHQVFSSKDENEVSEAPALTARLLSTYLKIFAGSGVFAQRHNTVIFINQLRQNIGSMYATTVRPGGNALPFYASVSLDIKRGDTYEDPATKVPNGHLMSIRVEKNKCGPSFQKAMIPLMYETGFDHAFDIVQAATLYGVVVVRGSWYQWHEVREQGRERFMTTLTDTNQWDALQQEVLARIQKDPAGGNS